MDLGKLLVGIGIKLDDFYADMANFKATLASAFESATAGLNTVIPATQGIKSSMDSVAQSVTIAGQQMKLFESVSSQVGAQMSFAFKEAADGALSFGSAAQSAVQAAGGLSGSGGFAGIAAASEELGASLQRTGMVMRDAGAGIIALGSVLSGVSLGIFELGKHALESAGKFEQWQVAFTVLLHSAEDARAKIAELTDFAIKTPFTIPGVIDSAQRLLAFGFTAKELIPILTTLGDAAAGTGKGAAGLNSLTLALGEMNSKGTVQLRHLNMMINQGVDAIQMLADAYGTSTAVISDLIHKKLISAAEGIPILLEGINEKFGGMMAKQAQTFSGALSNIEDAIMKTFKSIGDALLPLAKDVEAAIFAILGVIQEMAKGFGEMPTWVQSGVIALGLFAMAIGPVVLGIGGLVWSLGQILAVAPAVAAWLGTDMITVMATAEAAMFTLKSAILAVGVAMAAWKLGSWAYENSEGVRMLGDSIADILLFVPKMIPGFMDWAAGAESATLSNDKLRKNVEFLKDRLQEQGIYVGEAGYNLEQYEQALTKAARAAGVFDDALTGAARHAKLDLIAKQVQDITNTQKKLDEEADNATQVFHRLGATWGSSAEGAALVARANENMKRAIEAAHPAIKAQGQAFDDLSKTSHKMVDEVYGVLSKMPADLEDMIAGMGQGMNFSAMESSLTRLIENIKSSGLLADKAMGDFWQNMLDTVQSEQQRLAALLKEVDLVKMAGGFQDLVEKFPREFEKLPAATKGMVGDLLDQFGQLAEGFKKVNWVDWLRGALEAQKQVDQALMAIGTSLDKFEEKLHEIGEKKLKIDLTIFDKDNKDPIEATKQQITLLEGSITTLQGKTNAYAQLIIQLNAEQKKIMELLASNKTQDAGSLDALNDALLKIRNTEIAASEAQKALGVEIDTTKGKLTDQVAIWTGPALAAINAAKDAGIKSQEVLQKQLEMATKNYDILVKSTEPYNVIAAAQINMLEAQKELAVLRGKDAETILAIQEGLTNAEILQRSYNKSATELADAYNNVLEILGKTWDNMGKGFAQVLAGTEEWSKAWHKMFDEFKEMVAQFVVDYLMNKLKRAILENTDALGAFAKVFNSLFGAGSVKVGGGGGGSGVPGVPGGGGDDDSTGPKTGGFDNTSVGSALKSTLGIIGLVLDAISAIVQTIQLMKIEKTLSLIEVSTRRMDIIMEQSDGLLAWTKSGGQALEIIKNEIQGNLHQSLTDISSNLDTIALDAEQALPAIKQMAILFQKFYESDWGKRNSGYQNTDIMTQILSNIEGVVRGIKIDTTNMVYALGQLVMMGEAKPPDMPDEEVEDFGSAVEAAGEIVDVMSTQMSALSNIIEPMPTVYEDLNTVTKSAGKSLQELEDETRRASEEAARFANTMADEAQRIARIGDSSADLARANSEATANFNKIIQEQEQYWRDHPQQAVLNLGGDLNPALTAAAMERMQSELARLANTPTATGYIVPFRSPGAAVAPNTVGQGLMNWDTPDYTTVNPTNLTLTVEVNNADAREVADTMIEQWRSAGVPI